MNTDQELRKKLLDDDELENVELQKQESPVIVTGIAISTAKPSSKKTKKKGPVRRLFCCLCKCAGITMFVFALLGIVALGYLYSCVKDVVDHLTVETDSPQKFPIVKMSDSELNEVMDRVSLFFEDILFQETDIEDLVLEQDEINGFIGHSDYLRGNLMVTLHEDRLVEEYSLPMDVLGFDGRYFVGNDYLELDGNQILEMKMETEASHEDWFDGPLFFLQLQYLITKNKEDEGRNMLELYLEKGSFFGQVIPQEVIDERQNILEDLYHQDDEDSEDLREVISRIESVSIQEGKVVVKARRPKSN